MIYLFIIVLNKKMKTSIILVTYNFEKWFNEFFEKIKPTLDKRNDIELLIVENKSTDRTAEIFRKLLLEDEINSKPENVWHKTYLRNTHLYLSNKNTYFAKGNNIGIEKAIENNSEYVFLLNQDAFLKENALEKIEKFMDENPNCASSQPIILVKENKKINSSGVSLNFLHIGFCRDFNKDYNSKNYKNGENINYAMGAGCMFRVAVLKEVGLFPEEYQMYHEDSQLQLKMRYLGYTINLINEELVDHDYKFGPSSGKYKFYFTERNRLWNIITFYKWGTIIAILPMFIIMEGGMILYSIMTKWFKLKIKSYIDFFKGLPKILKYRKEIQKTRKIKDRDLLFEMVDVVQFDSINNVLLDKIANTILRVYYKFLKLIIRW